ncbi:DNA polymerase I [candidate division TA06 bacterium]|uniref:DNA polymerase I n=1 Tax=candidate division TA06 bacterium TaxID=2250710 RepID=A0A933I8Z9_UNCT6|nr:DNA polymerase I [candidate division TA06 bacterium]
MPKLILVDGTALAYRAHFGFIRNPLINSKGENTSASFGFTNMLMRMIKEHQPDYIGVAFDTSAPTFRDRKYAEYKAQRPSMPEGLRAQLPRIKEILNALNIAVLQQDGYEADDVLAGLAKQAEAKGWMSYIATGDKDLLQVVTERIKVIRPRVGKSDESIYGPEEVNKEYGVSPEKIKDIFALSGDAADNVPGVPGIGPKTATELIHQFGSFDELYKNLDQVKKPRIRNLLQEHKDQALLCKELVTLHLDQLPDIALTSLKSHQPDQEILARLFKELEFNSLYHEFVSGQIKKVAPQAVTGKAELELLAGRLQREGEMCLVIEAAEGRPVKLCLFSRGQALMIGGPDIKTLKKSFEDPEIAKTGHDLKTAIKALSLAGIQLNGTMFDTMIASYLLDPSRRGHRSLEVLAEGHLGVSLALPAGIFKKQTELDFSAEPGLTDELMARRADAVVSLRSKFEPELKYKELGELFQKIEMPLVKILAGMETEGILLDIPVFSQMSKELERQVTKLEKEIYRMAGEEFNLNSPKQLGTILFEKLKIDQGKKTKTGYSTDMDALTKLALHHELPKLILDYRQLYKLKSTYSDALPLVADPKTRRLHTTFNQALTETGRLSSSDPNLQNIPMREGVGREIRKGFIAPKGSLLLSADYSQVELRLVAHLSGDQHLRQAFKSGRDIHSETAAAVFGVKPDQAEPDMRRKAKAINFGIVYGMGPYGLSQQLGIGVEEASRFIEHYFNQFPQVQAWIALTIAQAKKDGYVCTMLGRRRYLPEINSENGQRRNFSERTAVNTPIQGTAADLIKLAMVNISRRLEDEKLRSKMILQVHDELLFEVQKDELAKVKKIVKHEMENAVELSVPIVVEMGEGDNWFEAH